MKKKEKMLITFFLKKEKKKISFISSFKISFFKKKDFCICAYVSHLITQKKNVCLVHMYLMTFFPNPRKY